MTDATRTVARYGLGSLLVCWLALLSVETLSPAPKPAPDPAKADDQRVQQLLAEVQAMRIAEQHPVFNNCETAGYGEKPLAVDADRMHDVPVLETMLRCDGGVEPVFWGKPNLWRRRR